MNVLHSRIAKWIPLATLLMILVVCFSLWRIMHGVPYTVVRGQNGVWDLRGFFFSSDNALLSGDVAYFPEELLIPAEFEARSAEAQIGNPATLNYSTSRMRVLVPDEQTYVLYGSSTVYADSIFINGRRMLDVGVPGASREEMVPGTALVTLTVTPVNGVIEIVQQVSNFVHREGETHASFYLGYSGVVRPGLAGDGITVIMGCFLALFLVHLTLFLIMHGYRANLLFSLLCLVWFFRTATAGGNAFSETLSAHSWVVKFRIEYISLPLTGLLVVMMVGELFAGLLSRKLIRAMCAVFGAYALFFMVADTVLMSWVLLACYACLGAAIVIVLVHFAARLRHPSMEQVIASLGVLPLSYAGIRDMFYYSGFTLPPAVSAPFAQIAVLIFMFFQMTAMFIATFRAWEEARIMERRLAAENASLDHVSRLKSDLIATIAHETRTPLAVLSGYAEIISMGLKRKGVDLETAADLDRMADEIQRIAKLMERMQTLSTARHQSASRAPVQIADILSLAVRMYEPILSRNKTSIVLSAQQDLPLIFANADEMTQLMFNLLTNAGNHTNNGEVIVKAVIESGCVAVYVEDTGTGISEDFLPRVFERGAKLSAEGSGLGLSICKDIVESHGGSIRVENRKEGGVSVCFTLPEYQPEEVKTNGRNGNDIAG